MKLVLPLPPSPNDLPSHHMAKHREKRKYQRAAWLAAVQQERPSVTPPKKVRMRATFYVHSERDEADNLPGSLKYALDALRQRQRGKLDWRQGLYDECGYFVDDNPRHLISDGVEQAVDRKNQRLEIELEAA